MNFLRRFGIALRRGFSVIGPAAVTAIFAAGVILTLWWVPKEQVALLKVAKVEPKEVFKAENDARATLAQILGGFAVLIGLYFAWKNIAATVRSLEFTNKNLELAKEGQITERFTKAIDQLGAVDEHGKPKLEVRLGGIYALERIARDSERDHWPIMEILIAYVREHTAAAPDVRDESSDNVVKNPLKKDIQAILTVIGRRARTYGKGEDRRLDLRDTHLENANLDFANLEGAYLVGAHLDGAYLTRALLTRALLTRTTLTGAHLEGALLTGALLDGADLSRAYLNGANLNDAFLYGALLYGADLAGAMNLTQRDVASTRGDEDTKLPSRIQRPESWKTTLKT